MIKVNDLRKEYITYQRGSGLGETLKSLFVRKKVVVSAVDGISFTIELGEIVGMLGRNGAGKSTTIKMLSGVLTPTSGSIDVMGYTPHKQRAKYVSHIGVMFGQKSQLVWDIPPLDSFLMNKAIYGLDNAEYKRTLDMLVSLLEAESIVSRPTRVLSLGERMKCEFIIAMLHKPEVVFLDEPTIGLDVIAKDSIRRFVKEMNSKGVTFILTTHDLGDIESLARRTIIIDNGTIVFQGSIEALKSMMGNKKTITVQTKSAVLNKLTLPGTTVLSEGDGKITITADLDLIPINELIAHINSQYELSDISISEPQMEEIVKAIYKSNIM